MRARTVGILSGLLVAVLAVALIVGLHVRSNANATPVRPPARAITLPANDSTPTVVNANFTIDAGLIEPNNLTVRAGTLVMLSAYAVTGPTKLIVPAAAVSTPLLSERQLQSFQFRINVPGSYEVLCNPCGAPNTLDTVNLTVE